ncbi:MAG: histidinol-phosphate aminotransferase family protein [Thermodesulfovibrionales bacterium]|nr:histidinol-phosphate aminotransferase family protein [Thermodesulfovibrionales bacterium]
MISSYNVEEERSAHCVLPGNEGNIYRAAEELHMQERKIMDFSFPVNPLGVSKKIKAELRQHLKYLNIYPDPEAKRLRKRLSQYHGIDPERILCGNGSSELLHLLIRVLRPRRVLIPAPTHQGYEKTVSRLQETDAGEVAAISYHQMEKADGFRIDVNTYIRAIESMVASPPNVQYSSQSVCMAFLCNPNSPTGRVIRKDEVRKIAEAAKENKCYLVLDEAFMDFCPGESVLADSAENPYLIFLKTMTYFHALAGLRIGYGVCAQELAREMEKCREPWTINSLAQRAAAIALKDRAYQNETYAVVRSEKKFLEKKFTKLGIEFIPSDANFYLVRIHGAQEVLVRLKTKGILVGDCSGFRGLDETYLHIAVKSHKENAVLIRELSKLMGREG